MNNVKRDAYDARSELREVAEKIEAAAYNIYLSESSLCYEPDAAERTAKAVELIDAAKAKANEALAAVEALDKLIFDL